MKIKENFLLSHLGEIEIQNKNDRGLSTGHFCF